ncbi:MAG TPA: efflux RND transporter permease subunit [Candidatus Hydrogenedentes bacterium]|nr:efflux RND transporter permease subunit [Candidatus Hydrogenedentota bacterium]
MNIAEYSIRKRVITYLMCFLMMAGGLYAYVKIGRLEDPEFTIKDALVLTPYPGATAYEVEEEVSDVIERAAQQMGQVDEVTSRSEPGLSIVTVTIKNTYDKNELPQVWDELRRKVHDAQLLLPPKAGPSLVNDDYGDVYGIYFALYGDGHTFAELYDTADFLQRELLLVGGVAKVALFGVQDETVYVEMSKERMASLGVTQSQIYGALSDKNLVADAGSVRTGVEYVHIRPTGVIRSVEDMKNLLIGSVGGRLVYLGDVAEVRRGYVDPQKPLLRYDGKPAIGIGISMVRGGNVVTMGDAVTARLKELEPEIPLGMEMGVINLQSRDVTIAVKGFVVNLMEAVIIVVVVLLITMGLRSGLIIGAVLILTIAATILVLYVWGVALERISLGALIIALGMLVDNAIVITEGMQVRIEVGMDRIAAASEIVSQTMYPLLGATVVAVTAFAPIGLSPDSTGEYCGSLFQVLFSSLMLSWVTAVTATPLFCTLFLKGAKKTDTSETVDPYGGFFFRAYRQFLAVALRFRWVAAGALVVLLVLAGFGFRFVESSFFPASTRPQFMVEVYLPRGTHIEETVALVDKVEDFILKDESFTHVTSMVGSGGLRFMLTYGPQQTDPSYAVLFVDVPDYRIIDEKKESLEKALLTEFPEANTAVLKFELGPGSKGKIRARFSGPDPDVLRRLAGETLEIYAAEPVATSFYLDWRERVKSVVAVLAEVQAQRAGISRPDVAQALKQAYEGVQVGVYREGDDLLPIVARAPESERAGGAASLYDAQVYSPISRASLPMRQVVSEFLTQWEDTMVMRRDRARTIEVWCDPKEGLASTLLERLMPKVEAIPLPPGYALEWGGEYEDSAKAQASIAANIPVPLIVMIAVVIVLFNSIRQPLVIWLCVPMAIIGVTAGLLLTHQPFGFMAMLGTLSLSGMLIKNAVILVDEINVEIGQGKQKYEAILDSAVSRVRPVSMAALTTVMGMLPLFTDAFFISMAVTIVFGLTFASILTLVVVPVLYAIIFRISPRTAET